MRLTAKLRRLLSGGNSKTERLSGQLEWSRHSVRSVEVTVQTDEVVLQPTAAAHPSNAALEQDAGDQTRDLPMD